jgi:hypothetical protein
MIIDTARAARVKQVFKDSREVAHVWAQQNQASGRNATRNIYFEGETIFSYGKHFPIARFAGRGVVLVNNNGWSNTTAGHKRDVDDALRGLPVTTIYVDDPSERADVSRNMAALWNDLVTLATQHRDARQQDHRPQLARLLRNYAAYAQFVRKGRTKKLAALLASLDTDQQFWAELAHVSRRAAAEIDAEKLSRAGATDARTQAKREREQAKRERGEALQAAIAPLAIQAWRDGLDKLILPAELASHFADCLSPTESSCGISVDRFIYNGWNQPTLLRIVGDEIQTSRGARVTVRAAMRAWPHLLAHNVPPQPIGQYNATEFAGGVLTIGCHRISVYELNRVAGQLGLEGAIVA